MDDEIECPYCHKDFEVDQDDGYNFDEGEMKENECPNCGKKIMIVSSCSWSWEAFQADCLNGAEHNWSEWHKLYDGDSNNVNAGKELMRRQCYDCGEEQKEWQIKKEQN